MNDSMHIVMLLDNPFTSDSRVQKEAESLINEGYKVTVLCEVQQGLPIKETRKNITIERCFNDFFKRPFGKTYKAQGKRLVEYIASLSFSILHCHDFMLLPIAGNVKKIKPGVFFTYDSHEYLKGWPYYKEIEKPINRLKGRLVWQRFLMLEKKYGKLANCLIGPSRAITLAQSKRLNLAFTGISVRNIPASPNTPIEINLKKQLGLSTNELLMVHSGSIYMPKSLMIELCKWIEKHSEMHFVIIGNRPIHGELKRELASLKHIHFIDFKEELLISQLAACDFGLIYTRANHYLAHQLGSSNKLMEYGIAGLPTVATKQHAHEELNARFGHMTLYEAGNLKELIKGINHLVTKMKQKQALADRIKYSLSWTNEFRPVIELYNWFSATRDTSIKNDSK